MCSLHYLGRARVLLRNAIPSLWSQAATIIGKLPPLVINGTLNALIGSGSTTDAIDLPSLSGVFPRPPLADVLVSAGVDAGVASATFAQELGEVLELPEYQ